MFTRISGLLTFILVLSPVSEAEFVEVDTGNGRFLGETRANYVAFEGVPYAEPPVGALRFEPPRPFIAKDPSEVFNATRAGSPCMQMNREFEVSGSEDCLFLNIYTPGVGGKLPVIVFIHGGGFIFGEGEGYLPGHLLRRPLVYVNINYRLGPLGFLRGDSIRGNMGMKDQVEALRFVKKNIAYFGGDPDQVTIAGWSAGGASVQLHFMSPMSKGLFGAGISHGGSALNPWVTQTEPTKKFQAVLRLTNCADVACLKEIPAERVVQTIEHLQPYKANPFNPFGVVVETEEDGFLLGNPLQLLRDGEFQKLPWIASGVREEGYYPCAEFLRDNRTFAELNRDFDVLIPALLHFPSSSSAQVPALVRQRYLGDSAISEATFREFVKISTDYLYLIGIQTSVELQGPHMPVYTYAFDFKTTYAYGELMSHRTKLDAVAHGEDIILIYESTIRNGVPFSPEENAVMNLLLDMYESFAYTRLPKMSNLSMIAGNGSDFTYIKGPADARVIHGFDFDSVTERPFWLSLEELILPQII